MPRHDRTASPALLKPSNADLVESIAAGLALILVYAVLLTRFDLRLLFSDTILTGGDSASWYQVLSTLKKDFLPHGRLFGFSQGNFFGYLEGQHYFILPFLSAALLGFVLPLTIALKIATLAGGFALPLTMFIAAALITGRKRAGAIAAAASLLFLFNESYSIFGGNWLSTFAGEFCFSWALALLPLLAASVILDVRNHRKGILSGFLLGFIGLSHFFVFMPAFFLPFFPAFGMLPRLIRKHKAKRRDSAAEREDGETTLRIMTSYGIAFLVMSFWLVPMALTRKWAQPISIIWRFSSLKDFARQTLAWVWAPLALLFILTSLLKRIPRERRHFYAFIVYSIAACAFLFFIAPGLGMPDIRFIPTALLFCALGISILGDNLLSRIGSPSSATRSLASSLPAAEAPSRPSRAKAFESAIPSLAALVLVLAASAGATAMARNSPAWYRWNYSGYEAKTEWPAMEALGKTYRGTPDDGRFLWEKQDQRDNRDFGSERAFENLSLFTGHPSSEGIHYGSSMMARAATYLQSSYSPNPVDPEAERIYSEIDPQSWPARFSLLNARYIITHTEQITSLFSAHPDFTLDRKFGKFSVFQFKGYAARYVSVLPDTALSVVAKGAGGFKTDYYRFFREYELYEFPFVSSEFADKALVSKVENSGGLWKSYDAYREVFLARAAVAGAATADDQGQQRISNEHVDNFSIRFETDSPGKPHYLRISYAPGWRSLGGEKIYPVSPGFMLIFPKSAKVQLVYGRTFGEILGILLSLLAIPIAFLLRQLRPGKRLRWRLLISLAFALFAIAAFTLILQTSAGYPALASDIEEARRLNLFENAQREKALDLVRPWATIENLDRFDNKLAFDAFRIEALAFLRQNKTEEAMAAIDILRRRYPHTRALESLPNVSLR